MTGELSSVAKEKGFVVWFCSSMDKADWDLPISLVDLNKTQMRYDITVTTVHPLSYVHITRTYARTISISLGGPQRAVAFLALASTGQRYQLPYRKGTRMRISVDKADII